MQLLPTASLASLASLALAAVTTATALAACDDSHSRRSARALTPDSPSVLSHAPAPRPAVADAGTPPIAPITDPAADPDGNDTGEDPGVGTIDPSHEMHPISLGRAPGGLRRICDLTVFQDALYIAGANSPLGSDGAVISRYKPVANDRGFLMAFDWNRPGQPTRGGGGGQGFLRVRAVGDRLFVPDADPPYGGFGISSVGTDGFVFVSNQDGEFARPRGATLRPPSVPSAQGYFGAGVLPRAYHVLDVLKFRGRYYASTGSVAPGQRAWYGASPGALHVANERLSRWNYAIDYPRPYQNGVWRLTFMTRFRGAIYAGIQDYDGSEPNDYVVIRPPAGVTELSQNHIEGRRVSTSGGTLTLRWYTDRGRLFWIALHRGNNVALRWTADGEHWQMIALPQDAGWPSDITRFRDSLVILTENGLYRIGDNLDPASIQKIGSRPAAPREQNAFRVSDAFCASPLAVYRNGLYAGSQLGSRLYRFE